MKKLVILLIFLIITISGLALGSQSQSISIIIDGSYVSFNEDLGYPFIDTNNRTQVPFRATLEHYGADVSWDGISKMAVASKDGIIVKVPLNENYILVNGDRVANDTIATIVDGRTYLPIRIVMEAFGCKVSWSGELFEVIIETPELVETTILPPVDFTSAHGFNLLSSKLISYGTDDTEDIGFEFMVANGFDIARIPISVDKLYSDDSYTTFSSTALQEIDDIIERGQAYDVHIILDLHMFFDMGIIFDSSENDRISLERKLEIWKDIFVMFANRYKDIPNTDMSFNLINEPFEINDEDYIGWITPIIKAIRDINPDRMIFIDNNQGVEPLYVLADFDDPYIVFSPHYYQPFQVTHYYASWVEGSDTYPLPTYPNYALNGYLYGKIQSGYQQNLTINGDFPKGTKVTVNVNQVSNHVEFNVNSNTEQLLSELFVADTDSNIWEKVYYNEEWGIYQNTMNAEFIMTVNQDANQLDVYVENGDWMTLGYITIDYPDGREELTLDFGYNIWGETTGRIQLKSDGSLDGDSIQTVINKDWLYNDFIKEMSEFKAITGIQVFIGEFGVYNHTPHDVSLRLITDQVDLFNEAGFGWTLWNLKGAFGIFDSGREDVDYDSYQGLGLDTLMLEGLK